MIRAFLGLEKLPALCDGAQLSPMTVPGLNLDRRCQDSVEEETDSGLPSSSEETGIPWSSLHARFNNSPVRRPGQVEEAYELWLMCRRPFGREFDRVLASRGLMEIEIRALRAVIEYYYMSSPKSSGSATPPPPTLESEVQPAQTEHVDFSL